MKLNGLLLSSLVVVSATFAAAGLAIGATNAADATIATVGTAPAGDRIGFGMDAGSVAKQTAAGVKPDYGTFWIGPWTLKSGWGAPDAQLTSMANAGVTPAIHHYYWGDDISQSCIENGCWSSLHGAQKDKAGWQTLTKQLVDHLNAKMGGKPVVIFLETEFNKGNVGTYEPLDGYLAEKAAYIKTNYPAAQVVLALGNWNTAAWPTWDRAAAKSDFIGIQGMRGSTRHTQTVYQDLYESTLAGAKTAKATFGKPVFIQDIALSSYPDATWASLQAKELGDFFSHTDDLRAAGVRAIVYRSWLDSPNMDLANWFGQAERHWGLATATTAKAAQKVWVDGVKAERATTTTTPVPAPTPTPAPTPVTGFTATMTPRASSNEWWVDVTATATKTISTVQISADGGAWTTLPKTSWGTYAKSMHIVKGTMVTLRATATDGQVSTGTPFAYLGATATAPAPAPAPAPTTFTATFAPKSVGNDYWVETAVTSSKTITKVEAKLGGGSWTVLPKDSWGTYAKSLNAPNGTPIVFRATNSAGQTATSQTVVWT